MRCRPCSEKPYILSVWWTIGIIFSQLKNKDNIKKRKKKLASLYMASQMIAEYAAQKIYKIVIMVSEYLIVKSKFYDFYAMNKAGEGVSFEALEFIVCRYHGYLPRVKRK